MKQWITYHNYALHFYRTTNLHTHKQKIPKQNATTNFIEMFKSIPQKWHKNSKNYEKAKNKIHFYKTYTFNRMYKKWFDSNLCTV